MDERGGMAYFMQNRGLGANPNPNPPQLLHGQQAMRSITNPSPLLGQSSPYEPVNMVNVSSSRSSLNSNSNSSSPVVGEQHLRRKRGRPRKYGPDGGPGLALSPLSITSHAGSISGGSAAAGPDSAKRGRGRPPGSGRKQQLASLGEFASTAGMGFTPHLIAIAAGEDIAAKIFSLSQQGPKAVSILSASGAVSSVTLRQYGNSGAVVRYEGRFDILCLSGSFVQTDEGRKGGLNVSLSSPDGRVVGGVVGGLLRAATPVHVVVGSFIYGGMKTKKKPNKTEQESSSHDQEPPISEDRTPLSSMMAAWPVSRQMDMRNSLDIDLTRG